VLSEAEETAPAAPSEAEEISREDEEVPGRSKTGIVHGPETREDMANFVGGYSLSF
jgi:hypothetical protein